MAAAHFAEHFRIALAFEQRKRGALAMPGSGMRMRSLGAVAGTEITGVDLGRPLDEATFADIEVAFDTHGVIVVRDQNITSKGDLVMWDNSTVQHKAILDYDLPQRRLLQGLTIAGAVPM
jgi:alpha-ketoglutarate-dependent taurine dioxygenase